MDELAKLVYNWVNLQNKNITCVMPTAQGVLSTITYSYIILDNQLGWLSAGQGCLQSAALHWAIYIRLQILKIQRVSTQCFAWQLPALWWCHDWHENILPKAGLLWGESTSHWWSASTNGHYVEFWTLCGGCWFEMPWCSGMHRNRLMAVHLELTLLMM